MNFDLKLPPITPQGSTSPRQPHETRRLRGGLAKGLTKPSSASQADSNRRSISPPRRRAPGTAPASITNEAISEADRRSLAEAEKQVLATIRGLIARLGLSTSNRPQALPLSELLKRHNEASARRLLFRRVRERLNSKAGKAVRTKKVKQKKLTLKIVSRAVISEVKQRPPQPQKLVGPLAFAQDMQAQQLDRPKLNFRSAAEQIMLAVRLSREPLVLSRSYNLREDSAKVLIMSLLVPLYSASNDPHGTNGSVFAQLLQLSLVIKEKSRSLDPAAHFALSDFSKRMTDAKKLRSFARDRFREIQELAKSFAYTTAESNRKEDRFKTGTPSSPKQKHRQGVGTPQTGLARPLTTERTTDSPLVEQGSPETPPLAPLAGRPSPAPDQEPSATQMDVSAGITARPDEAITETSVPKPATPLTKEVLVQKEINAAIHGLRWSLQALLSLQTQLRTSFDEIVRKSFPALKAKDDHQEKQRAEWETIGSTLFFGFLLNRDESMPEEKLDSLQRRYSLCLDRINLLQDIQQELVRRFGRSFSASSEAYEEDDVCSLASFVSEVQEVPPEEIIPLVDKKTSAKRDSTLPPHPIEASEPRESLVISTKPKATIDGQVSPRQGKLRRGGAQSGSRASIHQSSEGALGSTALEVGVASAKGNPEGTSPQGSTTFLTGIPDEKKSKASKSRASVSKEATNHHQSLKKEASKMRRNVSKEASKLIDANDEVDAGSISSVSAERSKISDESKEQESSILDIPPDLPPCGCPNSRNPFHTCTPYRVIRGRAIGCGSGWADKRKGLLFRCNGKCGRVSTADAEKAKAEAPKRMVQVRRINSADLKHRLESNWQAVPATPPEENRVLLDDEIEESIEVNESTDTKDFSPRRQQLAQLQEDLNQAVSSRLRWKRQAKLLRNLEPRYPNGIAQASLHFADKARDRQVISLRRQIQQVAQHCRVEEREMLHWERFSRMNTSREEYSLSISDGGVGSKHLSSVSTYAPGGSIDDLMPSNGSLSAREPVKHSRILGPRLEAVYDPASLLSQVPLKHRKQATLRPLGGLQSVTRLRNGQVLHLWGWDLKDPCFQEEASALAMLGVPDPPELSKGARQAEAQALLEWQQQLEFEDPFVEGMDEHRGLQLSNVQWPREQTWVTVPLGALTTSEEFRSAKVAPPSA